MLNRLIIRNLGAFVGLRAKNNSLGNNPAIVDANNRQRVLFKEAASIIIFRAIQYSAAYKGNHIQRQLSQAAKMKYYYPRISDMNVSHRYRDLSEGNESGHDD